MNAHEYELKLKTPWYKHLISCLIVAGFWWFIIAFFMQMVVADWHDFLLLLPSALLILIVVYFVCIFTPEAIRKVWFIFKPVSIMADSNGLTIFHYELSYKPVLLTWDKFQYAYACRYSLYHDEYYFNIIYTDKKGENKQLIIHALRVDYQQEKFYKNDIFDILSEFSDYINSFSHQDGINNNYQALQMKMGLDEWYYGRGIDIMAIITSILAFLIFLIVGYALLFSISSITTMPVNELAGLMFFVFCLCLLDLILIYISLKYWHEYYHEKTKDYFVRCHDSGLLINFYGMKDEQIIPWSVIYGADYEKCYTNDGGIYYKSKLYILPNKQGNILLSIDLFKIYDSWFSKNSLDTVRNIKREINKRVDYFDKHHHIHKNIVYDYDIMDINIRQGMPDYSFIVYQ